MAKSARASEEVDSADPTAVDGFDLTLTATRSTASATTEIRRAAQSVTANPAIESCSTGLFRVGVRAAQGLRAKDAASMSVARPSTRQTCFIIYDGFQAGGAGAFTTYLQ